ncbi:MAG: hypothetical protein ACI4DW_13210 [Lachnospiraceae bacterium]
MADGIMHHGEEYTKLAASQVQEDKQVKEPDQSAGEEGQKTNSESGNEKENPKTDSASENDEASRNTDPATDKKEEKQADSAPKSETKLMNPSLKYGKRMDYKTAKVSDGRQTGSLGLSLSGQEKPSKIHNPLPTPKKRVPRELEFDIEPSMFEMHFDLVDLDGKDFFDIN